MSADVELHFRWVTVSGQPFAPAGDDERWAIEHLEEELESAVHKMFHRAAVQKMTDGLLLVLLERVIADTKRAATGALLGIAGRIGGFQVDQHPDPAKWATVVWFTIKLGK